MTTSEPDQPTPHELGDLAARVAEHEGMLTSLARMMNESLQTSQAQQELLDRLATAVRGGQPGPGSNHPGGDPDHTEVSFSGWADRADVDDWTSLADWVDWLTGTYDLRDQVIHSCWPAHGGVVEELAALWLAWQQATGSCQEGDWTGDEALAYWHDRYLPGCLARLVSLYSLHDCGGATGHEPGPAARPTERDRIVVHATGEAPFESHSSHLLEAR